MKKNNLVLLGLVGGGIYLLSQSAQPIENTTSGKGVSYSGGSSSGGSSNGEVSEGLLNPTTYNINFDAPENNEKSQNDFIGNTNSSSNETQSPVTNSKKSRKSRKSRSSRRNFTSEIDTSRFTKQGEGFSDTLALQSVTTQEASLRSGEFSFLKPTKKETKLYSEDK